MIDLAAIVAFLDMRLLEDQQDQDFHRDIRELLTENGYDYDYGHTAFYDSKGELLAIIKGATCIYDGKLYSDEL